MTRLTNGFSKKWESLKAAYPPPLRLLQFLPCPFHTEGHACHGVGPYRSRLDDPGLAHGRGLNFGSISMIMRRFSMNRILKSALYGFLIAAGLCGIGIEIQKKVIVVGQTATAVKHAVKQEQVQDVAGKEANDRLMRRQKEFENGHTLANDKLDLANARLETDIARSQGKRETRSKAALAETNVNADEAAGYDTNWHGIIELSSKSAMMDDLTIMTLFMDCSEAIIEKHNTAYPKDKWASVAGIQDQLGGAPNTDRQELAATCAVDGNLAAAIRKRMQKEW